MPGQHLNEKELASKLNIGRTPVREALIRLAAKGRIVSVPREGYFTRPLLEGAPAGFLRYSPRNSHLCTNPCTAPSIPPIFVLRWVISVGPRSPGGNDVRGDGARIVKLRALPNHREILF
ncbi:GntR family transcriptional regulator [Ensifer psoraleae]|uniref:GntR family transcriptional regulator n=2 Tax=Sinorhizobium psoraleae TaxID=520838 RepID=A0ABT4KNU1_9HYPH|nr:GntR family transcriptional regulator [Sinorhizobium psoraleae]